MRLAVSLAAALLAASVVSAASAPLRTPCSGKKGGVDRCENGKFICKDGTTSASKKVCTPPDKPEKKEG